ncbi:MAG: hypothetical protein ACR2O6_05720 [Ilumatobacteraceae bacterium]
MIPTIAPLFLDPEPKPPFHVQLDHLRRLLNGHVTWAEPAHIDQPVGDEVDAVVIPDMNGLAYRMVESFRRIEVPILVITSEFGTVSMWDWEIRDHLRRRGVATTAPTSPQESIDICRALAVKKQMRHGAMLAYQDDLGAGMQPDIFKRFFWWEDECVDLVTEKLGVTIEHRSFRDLAARAAAIPESRADEEWQRWEGRIPILGLSPTGRLEAMRLYVALNDELDETGDVIAAGINCLNESASSLTTPCLAWNLLFEDRGIMWGCAADLTAMLTEYIVHKSLDVPVMMSNLYPFLLGDAALKHERIPYFPEVDEPQNHILVAHCGFFGVVPQSFATEWSVKPKVLAIVGDDAHALDARTAEGATTIVKLTSTLDTLTVTAAELTMFAQYDDSDCLNGAVLRVADGYQFVERLPSHHMILATGDITRRLDVITQVLDLDVERI